MLRLFSFVFGVWVGASFVAGPLAHGLIFLLTGKLPIPTKGGQQLQDVDEVTAYLRVRRQGAEERYRD